MWKSELRPSTAFVLVLIAVALAGCNPRSAVDQQIGTRGPHWLLASGSVNGKAWAFYVAHAETGCPTIGWANDVFGAGSKCWSGSFDASGVDAASPSAVDQGTGGSRLNFDAVVGFVRTDATAVLLTTSDGQSFRGRALHVKGFPVAFFVLTGPSILNGPYDIRVYTPAGATSGTGSPSG